MNHIIQPNPIPFNSIQLNWIFYIRTLKSNSNQQANGSDGHRTSEEKKYASNSKDGKVSRERGEAIAVVDMTLQM